MFTYFTAVFCNKKCLNTFGRTSLKLGTAGNLISCGHQSQTVDWCKVFVCQFMYHAMFSKSAWIEEASLCAHWTQLLEQAVSSCANTEASVTAIAANASTSAEDDIDFFNFIKSSTLASQVHLEFLNDNRTEPSNIGQTS